MIVKSLPSNFNLIVKGCEVFIEAPSVSIKIDISETTNFILQDPQTPNHGQCSIEAIEGGFDYKARHVTYAKTEVTIHLTKGFISKKPFVREETFRESISCR